jgi:hypothetical protein
MYKGSESMYNKTCAKIVLEHVLKLVDVKSAADVGCCLGTWTQSLIENGVKDVIPIDGPWCDMDLLSKHIDVSKFVAHDLNKGVFNDGNRYDLAICLEVAEHVEPQNELNVVETLVGLSDTILFSAAIPHQGGDGHVNEQWPSHWRELFRRYGYEFVDVIRPYIWTRDEVYRWYKQNMFIVTKQEKVDDVMKRFNELHIENQMLDVVHPKYWILKTEGKW